MLEDSRSVSSWEDDEAPRCVSQLLGGAPGTVLLGSVMQTRELLSCKRWQACIGPWSIGFGLSQLK
jgi:hypothetical protein